MTLIKSIKGRLPMNSGEYSSAKVYGKKYRCNLYGCEWESLMEGNTFAPAKLVEGSVVPDTVHWRLVSGVPENYNLKEVVNEIKETVGEGGGVDTRIKNAINALDADKSGTSSDNKVTVRVTETDGKISNVSVSTSDIASAYDVNNKVNGINTSINNINTNIANINTKVNEDIPKAIDEIKGGSGDSLASLKEKIENESKTREEALVDYVKATGNTEALDYPNDPYLAMIENKAAESNKILEDSAKLFQNILDEKIPQSGSDAEIDAYPTEESGKMVSSGGVYKGLSTIKDLSFINTSPLNVNEIDFVDITNVETIANKYINGRGELTEYYSSEACATDYIAVEPGFYVYIGGITQDMRICGYDANKDFIKIVSPAKMKTENVYKYVGVYVTDDVKYIRCSVYQTEGKYKLLKVVNDNYPLLADILNKHSLYTNNLFVENESVSLYKDNGYINQNGKFETLNYSYIYKVNVKENSTYLISECNVTDARSIGFSSQDDIANIKSFVRGSDLRIDDKNRTAVVYVPKGCNCMLISVDKVITPRVVLLSSANSQLVALFSTKMDSIQGQLNTVVPTIEEKTITLFNPNPSTGNFYLNGKGIVTSGFTGDKVTDFIEVNPNSIYRYKGHMTDARSYAEYNASKELVLVKTADTLSPDDKSVDEFMFKTQPTTKYVRFSVYLVDSCQLDKFSFLPLKEEIEKLKNSIDNIKDYNIAYPTDIYTVINDCYNPTLRYSLRNYAPKIYIDRLLEKHPYVLFGNSSDSIRISLPLKDAPSANIYDEVMSQVVRGYGYIEKDLSITIHGTKNSVAVDKDIRLMCLGDSLTDADWVSSYIKKLFAMDNIDYKKRMSVSTDRIKIQLIGIKNAQNENTDCQYRGEHIQFIDYNEGRSGWSTQTYLRHATPLISDDEQHILWRITGLYEQHNAEYDNNISTHVRLCAKTCNGQYPITIKCIDELVWNHFRNRIGLGSISFSNATNPQKELMLHYLDGTGENNLLDNPDNPFFSKEKVFETRNTDNCYAFDWKTYFNRYKTHNNDGSELSQKGTKATKDMHVCVPNFVAINLGENDWHFWLSDSEKANDVYLIAELLKQATNASILVYNCSNCVRSFAELARTNFYINSHDNTTYERNKAFMDKLGTLSNQKANGIYYCPAYYVQRFNTIFDSTVVDIGEDITPIGGISVSDVHPSKEGYMDLGFELYSMILYLLA